MGTLIVIVIIMVACVVYGLSLSEKYGKERADSYSKRGYHYVEKGDFHVYYKGGIKSISVNSNIIVVLLKEGLAFESVGAKKIILFSNIKDISLQNEVQIQQQVSLGKLILFGGLAFGMEKKKKEINNEYIVLTVVDKDGEYNVLLQSYDQNDNQKNYRKLRTYRSTSNIERKNKIVESNNPQESKESNKSQENNVYKDIEELAKLKDKGILTEEEFAEKKKMLLDRIK